MLPKLKCSPTTRDKQVDTAELLKSDSSNPSFESLQEFIDAIFHPCRTFFQLPCTLTGILHRVVGIFLVMRLCLYLGRTIDLAVNVIFITRSRGVMVVCQMLLVRGAGISIQQGRSLLAQ